MSVVTVAGNLDTDSWTDYHGYTPLYRSLNPAKQSKLPSHIQQLHLLGGRDMNIRPDIVMDWLERDSQRSYRLYPQHRHRCCWVNDWQQILREFE